MRTLSTIAAISVAGSNERHRKIRPSVATDGEAVQRIYAQCVALADWLPAKAKEAPDFARVSEGEVVCVAVGANARVPGFVAVWERESFIHH
ncbi:MAG: hypothetical protein H7Z75_12725, partial [Ferruginibacter sp.]|nr:hypothetical protein [Cytophagales bacterium]